MSQQPQPDPSEIILSATDINRAGAEGVISQSDVDRLIHWAYDQRFKGMLLADPPPPPAPEKAKGFNLVMVLYYFGALLMISACAWFSRRQVGCAGGERNLHYGNHLHRHYRKYGILVATSGLCRGGRSPGYRCG